MFHVYPQVMHKTDAELIAIYETFVAELSCQERRRNGRKHRTPKTAIISEAAKSKKRANEAKSKNRATTR